MSDIDRVLARIETDFDFYLAVRGDPQRAFAPFELSRDERDALAHSGRPLWSLVLRHISRGPTDSPDGGLPPPPPPFVVHHSIPAEFERWRGDREADLTALREDPAVQAAVRAVRGANTPTARMAAVAQLMERIG